MSTLTGSGWQALIDSRIEEAIANGEFDDLPGAGKPLDLDDDRLVPEDLRVAYRLLKNAGYVPPELETVSDVNRLLGEVARGDLDEAQHRLASRRLRVLLIQLELAGRVATAATAWRQYDEALARRMNAPARKDD